MSLQFGRIKDFRNRGFGFIHNNGPNAFFHIKTINNSFIKEKLKNNSWKTEDIYVWFKTNKNANGTFAEIIWIDIKDIPSTEIENYLQKFVNNKSNGNLMYFKKALKEIFDNFDVISENGKINLIVEKLLNKDFIKSSPYNIAKMLPEKFKVYFANTLGIEELWNNDNIPLWLETTTEELIDEKSLIILKKNREKKIIEIQTQREKEKLAIQKQLKEEKLKIEAEKLNRVHNLIEKHKVNPKGIRYEVSLSNICIKCGSDKVVPKSEKQYNNKVCRNCGSEWYVNHCWNCGENVDERDTENPKCTTCGWLKCTCGACNYGGCITNPYSKDNRLKDKKNTNDKIDFLDEEINGYKFNINDVEEDERQFYTNRNHLGYCTECGAPPEAPCGCA